MPLLKKNSLLHKMFTFTLLLKPLETESLTTKMCSIATVTVSTVNVAMQQKYELLFLKGLSPVLSTLPLKIIPGFLTPQE